MFKEFLKIIGLMRLGEEFDSLELFDFLQTTSQSIFFD